MAFNTVLANLIQEVFSKSAENTSRSPAEEEFLSQISNSTEWKSFVDGELAARNKLNTHNLVKPIHDDSDSEEDSRGYKP